MTPANWRALLFIVFAAGCSAGASTPPAAREDQRCPRVVLPPLSVSQAAWARLEPSLRHHYDVWRARVAMARCLRQRGELDALEAERVTVAIDYEGGVARALRAAGLQPGYDSGHEVSGQIALRELERLAGVPGIVRMTVQPETHPD